MKYKRQVNIYLIFAVMLVTALSGVNYWGSVLRRQAVTTWKGKAANETRRITDISLSRLSLIYSQLSGMAALLYGSEIVTESEFLKALEMIKGIEVGAVIPLPTVAYVEYRTTKQYSTQVDPTSSSLPVMLSSDKQGLLAIGADLVKHPAIRTTIDLALTNADEVVMGPVFQDTRGQVFATLAIKAYNGGKPGFLLSMINLSEFMDDLSTLYIPDGLNLRVVECREALAGGHGKTIFGTDTALPSAVTTSHVHVQNGYARWDYYWDTLPNYQGGAAVLSGTIVQFGGSILVLTIFTAITSLAWQNMRVNRLVIERATELTQEVAERKKTEEKYKTLFEGATDAIFIADTQTGVLLDCNDEATKLLERDKSQIIGQSHTVLHPKQEKPGQFYETFKKHLENPDQILETQAITKTGKIKEVAIKTNILEIGGKKVLQGIFRDITEKKQKEKELLKVHNELVATSYRAGMAEGATEVLHNVGNVLNSINVSTTVITDKVKGLDVQNLEKVAGLINDHIEEIGTFFSENPQGQHIPVFLAELSKLLVKEQAETLDKLQVLSGNVQHIKDIISMQQSYAKTTEVEVTISPVELVEDAIQINSTGLQRRGTRLVREFEELPDIEINKQKLLQILINLISNAKYATSSSSKEDKIITVRILKHREDRFRVEVADNGVGISRENLPNMFKHGFTTKEDGHGFGLHSSARAAKELGGELTVYSEGEEKGATFTLELPLKTIRTAQNERTTSGKSSDS